MDLDVLDLETIIEALESEIENCADEEGVEYLQNLMSRLVAEKHRLESGEEQLKEGRGLGPD